VAYGKGGARPYERASKISHAQIINNSDVQRFLDRCTLPSRPTDHHQLDPLLIDVPIVQDPPFRAIVAIDGGYNETFVRQEYPSASLTFFTFGPLLFPTGRSPRAGSAGVSRT